MSYAGLLIGAVILFMIDRRRLSSNTMIAAYLIIYIPALILACMVMANPDLPGPSQWMSHLFEPFNKLIFSTQ